MRGGQNMPITYHSSTTTARRISSGQRCEIWELIPVCIETVYNSLGELEVGVFNRYSCCYEQAKNHQHKTDFNRSHFAKVSEDLCWNRMWKCLWIVSYLYEINMIDKIWYRKHALDSEVLKVSFTDDSKQTVCFFVTMYRDKIYNKEIQVTKFYQISKIFCVIQAEFFTRLHV